MMTGVSAVADEYGMDVWIWYPALDKDYSDPATVELALHEWAEVFAALPRIDAIFVPGGDPGHTQPDVLMALLEKQTRTSTATTRRRRCGCRRRAFRGVDGRIPGDHGRRAGLADRHGVRAVGLGPIDRFRERVPAATPSATTRTSRTRSSASTRCRTGTWRTR